MRLGIFGGTFDPPHLGHLILAAEALDQLGLDRLLFVLTPDPPHKQGQKVSTLQHRLDMLALATGDNLAFELSRVDMDRQPPHYAVDTVRILGENFSGAQLVYLMGGDSLRDLPTWHNPKDFVEACDEIGVMRRPGDEIDLSGLEGRLPGASEKVHFVDAPLLEIASSEIRQRVASGHPYRYYLPDGVFQYIRDRGLYREG